MHTCTQTIHSFTPHSGPGVLGAGTNTSAPPTTRHFEECGFRSLTLFVSTAPTYPRETNFSESKTPQISDVITKFKSELLLLHRLQCCLKSNVCKGLLTNSRSPVGWDFGSYRGLSVLHGFQLKCWAREMVQKVKIASCAQLTT